MCNLTVGSGKGTVLHFGAKGRVHTEKCLEIAQKVTLPGTLAVNDPQPLERAL